MKDVVTLKNCAVQKTELVPFKKSEKRASSQPLIRNAFKMKLKPGFQAEYKRRHDEIWPELSRVLTEAGVSDYGIYLDEETNTLFAFQKLTPDHGANNLPKDLIVRKWWDYMSDIMEYNDDNTPVSIPLEEMFHMD